MASFGNVLLIIDKLNFHIDIKTMLNEIMKKIKWAEEIFYIEYGIPYNKDLWEDKEYLNHTDYTKQILLNWEHIRPQLLEFNYIPLVAQNHDLKIDATKLI